ncbi:MAG TPA: alpha/beta hydrolase, partial [Candidatus Baltobacteraceae bacterium]|nr:alpha/beta hydrolase [Candidatus Baltobacteraceae bacterium]
MTLVFVHGAGFTGRCFAAQIQDFPDAHSPDLPGRDGHAVSASIEDFATWLEAYVRKHGLEDVTLCGHSMGGAVALAVALRHNVPVRSLVLLGSGARLRVAPVVLHGLENSFDHQVRTLAGLFFAQPRADRVEWAVASMLAVGREQTLNDFLACDAFDALERLSGVTVPLLAITGEHDNMTPPKYAATFAD